MAVRARRGKKCNKRPGSATIYFKIPAAQDTPRKTVPLGLGTLDTQNRHTKQVF
jgi:hypothetical protein